MFTDLFTAARSKSYRQVVHLWLPEDEDEAHRTLVDLSRSHHTAGYSKDRISDLMNGGGFSHHPTNGAAPDSGWFVSVDSEKEPHRSSVHHISELTPGHIKAHRKANKDALEQGGHYQGGWLDRGTGHVYLDVSRHFPEEDHDKVRQFALDHRQKAYYHASTGDEHFLHPQHDPLMLQDHNAWADKYRDHMQVPDQYRSYEHLYPASDELRQHLDSRSDRLAAVNRDIMRAHARAQRAGWIK